MISVFTEHITPRLTHVLDFCFTQRGIEYQLITTAADWSKVNNARINYSNLSIPCDYLIKPHGLLFEEGIRDDIHVSNENDDLRMDGMEDEFALIFRFMSRYEEYLPHERDEHDRYKASNSELVRLNLSRKPVVDILNKKIWNKLGLDYGVVEKGFECVPSFDIDVAWAYKHRRIGRSIGAGLMRGKLRERLRVLMGKERDPYDTYSYIMELSAKVNRIICFALLGDWSKYNKNIHYKDEAYGSLIRGLNASGGMGIHPSYEAYLNPDKIQQEIERLEHIVGHEIVKSRQHFLRLRIPQSYEILIEKGIQRDFTMGYSDATGFRAGTSFPFYFFNLRTNKSTQLLVFPFAYMDGILKDHLKMTPDEAKIHNAQLIQEVKQVGGVFMCIWHNSTINDLAEWKGWKAVLDHTISLVERNDFSNFDEDFFD